MSADFPPWDRVYAFFRQLARDYECVTTSAEAMVHWSMILLMTRRLARPHPQRA